MEVGSVEVEGGGGFTYATGENTTTLWPGWFLYYVLLSPGLFHFCILFPSSPHPHLSTTLQSFTSSHLHLHPLSYPTFLTLSSSHSTLPLYWPQPFPFLCPPSLFVLLLLDGLPPRVSRINTIAIPLTVIYYILTTAVILFGVVCIVFNFVYRKRK